MIDITFRLEQDNDSEMVESLIKKAFPNANPNRAVSILRKNPSWQKEYCFVADNAGDIVGSIRFSKVKLPSGKPVVMLGPLSVAEKNRGQGIGQTLVENALHALAGREDGVLIIGMEDYYDVYGFEKEVVQNLKIKGDIAPFEFMGLEFEDDIFYSEKGFVTAL